MFSTPGAPLWPEARGICHVCHMVNPALSPQHIDRETCYQLSSRKVDAQSVINWAVFGQLSR